MCKNEGIDVIVLSRIILNVAPVNILLVRVYNDTFRNTKNDNKIEFECSKPIEIRNIRNEFDPQQEFY